MAVNSMSHAPIPIDKLHWYARNELELDDDERQAFVWIMRRVDSSFVAKMNKRDADNAK
jgi:hypothetical protein